MTTKLEDEIRKRNIYIDEYELTPKGVMHEVKRGERVGNCSLCEEPAAVNTPHIRPNGDLVCNRCVDHAAKNSELGRELLIGVDQFLTKDGQYIFNPRFRHFSKRNVVLMISWWKGDLKDAEVHCWTDGGMHAWPLTKAEMRSATRNPEKILDSVADIYAAGYFKCTDCNRYFKVEDVGGYPLFAGRVCETCMAKHRRHLEFEKKTGNVCLLCGQPRSNCCC